MKLFQMDILVPVESEDYFAAFLSEHVSWGWEVQVVGQDRVKIIVHLDTQARADDLQRALGENWPDVEYSVASCESRDWSESWKEYFEPVAVWGTFLVVPPWRAAEAAGSGLIPLIIAPKMAFGTGHHATTVLCLEAVARLWADRMISPDANFLDLGTGSGILALACVRLGLSGLAMDIDPVAVDNALENQSLNKAEARLSIRRGDLNALEQGRRFGLILANILAGPLARMASGLVRRLEPGGCLVLSGILREQAARVETAYRDQGLPAPRVFTRGEWAALVWGERRDSDVEPSGELRKATYS